MKTGGGGGGGGCCCMADLGSFFLSFFLLTLSGLCGVFSLGLCDLVRTY